MPITPFGILTSDDVDAELSAGRFVPACLVENAATATTLATGASTLLNLGVSTDEKFDNDGLLDLTAANFAAVSRSGLWQVEAIVAFTANATGYRSAFPRIDGVGGYGPTIPSIGGTFTTNVEFTSEHVLTAGQAVSIGGLQTSGGNLNAILRRFHMHLIAPSP